MLQDKAENRRYKYYVQSSNTKKGIISQFEFIAGPKTKSGQIIDRSLKLYVDVKELKYGSK